MIVKLRFFHISRISIKFCAYLSCKHSYCCSLESPPALWDHSNERRRTTDRWEDRWRGSSRCSPAAPAGNATERTAAGVGRSPRRRSGASCRRTPARCGCGCAAEEPHKEKLEAWDEPDKCTSPISTQVPPDWFKVRKLIYLADFGIVFFIFPFIQMLNTFSFLNTLSVFFNNKNKKVT